jgi:hypothetical protein
VGAQPSWLMARRGQQEDRAKFEAAVRSYWTVRASQQAAASRPQAGGRGAVTGGAQMDALAALVEEYFVAAGFDPDQIGRGTCVELPGYFRPEKRWDLVVTHGDSLAAAIEFKSQVGPSFGNNYNNRIEEAIGSATDIWTAWREGRFGNTRPWLGYLFLLEEEPGSVRPVSVREPWFAIDDVYRDASYKERYAVFCQRLVRERLYDAACFITADSSPRSPINEPAAELSFASFVAAIKARAAALFAIES